MLIQQETGPVETCVEEIESEVELKPAEELPPLSMQPILFAKLSSEARRKEQAHRLRKQETMEIYHEEVYLDIAEAVFDERVEEVVPETETVIVPVEMQQSKVREVIDIKRFVLTKQETMETCVDEMRLTIDETIFEEPAEHEQILESTYVKDDEFNFEPEHDAAAATPTEDGYKSPKLQEEHVTDMGEDELSLNVVELSVAEEEVKPVSVPVVDIEKLDVFSVPYAEPIPVAEHFHHEIAVDAAAEMVEESAMETAVADADEVIVMQNVVIDDTDAVMPVTYVPDETEVDTAIRDEGISAETTEENVLPSSAEDVRIMAEHVNKSRPFFLTKQETMEIYHEEVHLDVAETIFEERVEVEFFPKAEMSTGLETASEYKEGNADVSLDFVSTEMESTEVYEDESISETVSEEPAQIDQISDDTFVKDEEIVKFVPECASTTAEDERKSQLLPLQQTMEIVDDEMCVQADSSYVELSPATEVVSVSLPYVVIEKSTQPESVIDAQHDEIRVDNVHEVIEEQIQTTEEIAKDTADSLEKLIEQQEVTDAVAKTDETRELIVAEITISADEFTNVPTEMPKSEIPESEPAVEVKQSEVLSVMRPADTVSITEEESLITDKIATVEIPEVALLETETVVDVSADESKIVSDISQQDIGVKVTTLPEVVLENHIQDERQEGETVAVVDEFVEEMKIPVDDNKEEERDTAAEYEESFGFDFELTTTREEQRTDVVEEFVPVMTEVSKHEIVESEPAVEVKQSEILSVLPADTVSVTEEESLITDKTVAVEIPEVALWESETVVHVSGDELENVSDISQQDSEIKVTTLPEVVLEDQIQDEWQEGETAAVVDELVEEVKIVTDDNVEVEEPSVTVEDEESFGFGFEVTTTHEEQRIDVAEEFVPVAIEVSEHKILEKASTVEVEESAVVLFPDTASVIAEESLITDETATVEIPEVALLETEIVVDVSADESKIVGDISEQDSGIKVTTLPEVVLEDQIQDEWQEGQTVAVVDESVEEMKIPIDDNKEDEEQYTTVEEEPFGFGFEVTTIHEEQRIDLVEEFVPVMTDLSEHAIVESEPAVEVKQSEILPVVLPEDTASATEEESLITDKTVTVEIPEVALLETETVVDVCADESKIVSDISEQDSGIKVTTLPEVVLEDQIQDEWQEGETVAVVDELVEEMKIPVDDNKEEERDTAAEYEESFGFGFELTTTREEQRTDVVEEFVPATTEVSEDEILESVPAAEVDTSEQISVVFPSYTVGEDEGKSLVIDTDAGVKMLQMPSMEIERAAGESAVNVTVDPSEMTAAEIITDTTLEVTAEEGEPYLPELAKESEDICLKVTEIDTVAAAEDQQLIAQEPYGPVIGPDSRGDESQQTDETFECTEIVTTDTSYVEKQRALVTKGIESSDEVFEDVTVDSEERIWGSQYEEISDRQEVEEEREMPTSDEWFVIEKLKTDEDDEDYGFSVEEEESFGYGFEYTTTEHRRTKLVRSCGEDGEIIETRVVIEKDEDDDEESDVVSSRGSSISDSGDFGPEIPGITVYTSTVEGEPDVETELNEYEDVLPDGTVVRRRVLSTRCRQTVTKRVVLEGLEDDDSPFDDVIPALSTVEGLAVDDRCCLMTRYSDRSTTDPELSTEVQQSEDSLPDGTRVQKRTTTRHSQQLTTERLVVAGTRLFVEGSADDEDEVFDNLRRIGSPTSLIGMFHSNV